MDPMQSRPDYLSILARAMVKATALIVCVYILVPMAGRHFADQHTAPANSTSDLYSTAAVVTPVTDDVTAEGTDVLMLDYEAAPDDLWQGLIDAGYRGTGNDICECLYIPVGTVVDVPGGQYMTTLDGWTVCRDEWQRQACSSTASFYLIDITIVPAAPSSPALST